MIQQNSDIDLSSSKTKDLLGILSNASYEDLQKLYTKMLSFDSTVSSEMSRRKSLLSKYQIKIIDKKSREENKELTNRFQSSDIKMLMATLSELIYYGVIWVEVIYSASNDEFQSQLIIPDSITLDTKTSEFKFKDIDSKEIILNSNKNMFYFKYGNSRIQESGLAYSVATPSIFKYFLSRSFLDYTEWQNKPLFLIADRGNCIDLIDDEEEFKKCKEKFRQEVMRGLRSNIIIYDDPITDLGEAIYKNTPVSVIEPSSAMDSLVSQLNNIEKQIISTISGNDSIGQTTNLAGSRASLEVFERSLDDMVETDKLYLLKGLKDIFSYYCSERGLENNFDLELVKENLELRKEEEKNG